MSSLKEFNTTASEMKRIKRLYGGECLKINYLQFTSRDEKNSRSLVPSLFRPEIWVNTNHLHEKKWGFELRTVLSQSSRSRKNAGPELRSEHSPRKPCSWLVTLDLTRHCMYATK